MAAPTNNKTGTIVVEDPTLRKGFTLIPNYVLRNSRLSFGARLTYTLLLSYAWQEGSCFPGQEKLAGDLQSDPRSVRRYLSELKAEGLIEVERRGLGQTNVYTLLDVRPRTEPDRTEASTLERTGAAAQDRTEASDKEDSGEEDPGGQRLSAVNRLAADEVSGKREGKPVRVAEVLFSRPPPNPRREVVDKKLEVKPLAEEAARRLGAPESLGMFYKVLLQLYPEHHYLFEEAVKEAAAEPKLRVSRSALFVHIVRRLAHEHGVGLSLGERSTS